MSKNTVKNLLAKINENEVVINKMMCAPGKLILENDGVTIRIDNITDNWFMEKSEKVKDQYLEKLALQILVLFRIGCGFELHDKIKFSDSFIKLFKIEIDYLKLSRPKEINLNMAITLGHNKTKIILAICSFKSTKALHTVSTRIQG